MSIEETHAAIIRSHTYELAEEETYMLTLTVGGVEFDSDLLDADEVADALRGLQLSALALLHSGMAQVAVGHELLQLDRDDMPQRVMSRQDWYEFECRDCGASTFRSEYYMVKDELWQASGMAGDGGMLCIGCLEKRLGRELAAPDFTDAPVNWSGAFAKSERLLERLARR